MDLRSRTGYHDRGADWVLTGDRGKRMLLEKERERLLAVLQSRTASHQERDHARRTLEQERSPSERPEEARAESTAPDREPPEAPAAQS